MEREFSDKDESSFSSDKEKDETQNDSMQINNLQCCELNIENNFFDFGNYFIEFSNNHFINKDFILLDQIHLFCYTIQYFFTYIREYTKEFSHKRYNK